MRQRGRRHVQGAAGGTISPRLLGANAGCDFRMQSARDLRDTNFSQVRKKVKTVNLYTRNLAWSQNASEAHIRGCEEGVS